MNDRLKERLGIEDGSGWGGLVPDRGTYKVFVKCSNCRHREDKDIPKGQPMSNQKCSNCGCRSLIKQ